MAQGIIQMVVDLTEKVRQSPEEWLNKLPQIPKKSKMGN